MSNIPLLIGVGFVVFCVYVVSKRFISVTVWEYEKGLKYHKGRFVQILEPGRYRIYSLTSHIANVDMRPQIVHVIGQEVLSADNITLKISISVRYRVIDPITALNKVKNYSESLHLIIQLAVREIISSIPIDELLEKRSEFDSKLAALCEPQIPELGLSLLSIGVRDIMFPGDLKNVFAKVVKARKEGLAALEKARGETAALRNLANASKMMENNPSLLQLRVIQALGEASGNTIVFGISNPDAAVPLTVTQTRIVDREEKNDPA